MFKKMVNKIKKSRRNKEGGVINNFINVFKKNITRDVEYIRGEGSIRKAEDVYISLIHLGMKGWNAFITAIQNLLIKMSTDSIMNAVQMSKGTHRELCEIFDEKLLRRLDERNIQLLEEMLVG